MLQTEHHINVNKPDMTEVLLWCGQVVVADTGVIIVTIELTCLKHSFGVGRL